jgi:hypothetical protein
MKIGTHVEIIGYPPLAFHQGGNGGLLYSLSEKILLSELMNKRRDAKLSETQFF